MSKKKTGILRHIADLIFQNKSLAAENEMLNRQNEMLTSEAGQISRTCWSESVFLILP